MRQPQQGWVLPSSNPVQTVTCAAEAGLQSPVCFCSSRSLPSASRHAPLHSLSFRGHSRKTRDKQKVHHTHRLCRQDRAAGQTEVLIWKLPRCGGEVHISCSRTEPAGRRCCCWGGRGGPGRTAARLGWSAQGAAGRHRKQAFSLNISGFNLTDLIFNILRFKFYTISLLYVFALNVIKKFFWTQVKTKCHN